MRVRGGRHARLGLGLAAGLLAAAPAAAQSGAIEVRLIDGRSGASLPGATVTLSNANRLISPTAQLTDADGRAVFPILRAGAGYVLDVSMPGFAAQRRTEIEVHANQTMRLEVRLGEALEERVEVRAQQTVVDVTAIGASTRFSDEFIEDLPAPGRFYQDMLKLAPGISDHDGDGNPNVHGSRPRDFRAEVSGVSNVDPLTGYWFGRINADSIEELEVLPQGAGVEFGRAQGGFARIVQKQGGNDIDGVFSLLYRSSVLDQDGAGTTDRTAEEVDYATYEPAFQISGPVIRDKLWFRLSHQYVQREQPSNLLGEISVQTSTQWLNADQLTWQLDARNKFAFQYQNDPQRIEGLEINSRIPLESSRTLERRGPTYAVTWTAAHSATLLWESTLAYQDHSVDVVPTVEPYTRRNDCATFIGFPGPAYAHCEILNTGFQSGAHYETSRDERERLTVRTQATLQRQLFGQGHRFKVGFLVEDEKYLRDLERRPTIAMRINWSPFASPVPTAALSFRAWMPVSSPAKAVGSNVALWVEDQWRPADGLSVTLGVRVDREEISSRGREEIDPAAEAQRFRDLAIADGIDLGEWGTNGTRLREIAAGVFTASENLRQLRAWLAEALLVPAGAVRLEDILFQTLAWEHARGLDDVFIENTNYSPRVSLAWDPWTNGKTKIFGSAGRYYDKIFLGIPLVELEPAETNFLFTALGRRESPPPDGPPPPWEFVSRNTQVGIAPLSIRYVDRDLQTPYQDEWSVGFERELRPELALRAMYLERDFRDQFQDVDVNSAPGDFGRCQLVPAPSYPFLFDSRLTPSPGQGPLVDPFTFESYMDTDAGAGDGRTDDCEGRDILGGPSGQTLLTRPDGVPESYLQNPAWREMLLLGNFNATDYEAFVLELIKRRSEGWEMEASYTWSQAVGDAEDFDLLLGNEQALHDDERGRLSYHQRHVVKANATFSLGGDFRVGTSIRWESGLPYSILTSSLRTLAMPPYYPYSFTPATRLRFVYPTGQRNDRENPAFWTVDLRLAKDLRFSRSVAGQISVEAFNLLNDDTIELESRTDSLNVGTRRFGREWQLGLRVTF